MVEIKVGGLRKVMSEQGDEGTACQVTLRGGKHARQVKGQVEILLIKPSAYS